MSAQATLDTLTLPDFVHPVSGATFPVYPGDKVYQHRRSTDSFILVTEDEPVFFNKNGKQQRVPAHTWRTLDRNYVEVTDTYPGTPPVPVPPKGQWQRPAKVTVEVIFGEDNRKVIPADLETAGVAGAAAIRAYLEGRTKPYSISEVNVEVDYIYVQSTSRFQA